MNNDYGLFLLNYHTNKWSFQVPRIPKKYGIDKKSFVYDGNELPKADEYYEYAHYDFKDLVDEFLKICGLKPTASGAFYQYWSSNVNNNNICIIRRSDNKIYTYKEENRNLISEQAIYEYFDKSYHKYTDEPTSESTQFTRVIALCGDIGAGKDTTAAYLKQCYENLNQKVLSIAFADRVKDIVAASHPEFIDRKKLQGITLEDREWRNQEIPVLSLQYGETITPRRLMQIYGDLYREMNPDFWINAVKNQVIQARKNNVDVVIITDCRFINELKFVLQDLHAYLVEIKRDGGSPWIKEYLETGNIPKGKHSSDVDWIKYVNSLERVDRKFTFENTTDNLSVLHNQIDQFISEIE